MPSHALSEEESVSPFIPPNQRRMHWWFNSELKYFLEPDAERSLASHGTRRRQRNSRKVVVCACKVQLVVPATIRSSFPSGSSSESSKTFLLPGYATIDRQECFLGIMGVLHHRLPSVSRLSAFSVLCMTSAQSDALLLCTTIVEHVQARHKSQV